MSRTNIEIDDELIARVMRRNALPTKRAAVDWALRKVDVEPMSIDEALAMEGTGWGDGELELSDVRPGYTPWTS
jgi:Arc/MetJ family transcription regulator